MNPQSPAAFAAPLRHFEEVLRGIRSGRATTGLVEPLTVEHYGATLRMKELASITTPDPATIQIDVWDPAAVPAVETAIETSALGLTPSTAGTVIRLRLPPLTEERRRELTKLVGKHAEDARVAVRNVREKTLRHLKKRQEAGELSDDAFRNEKAAVEKDVQAALATIETLREEKERDVSGQA